MSFHSDLEQVINRHSREGKSGTPAHILATVAQQAIENFETSTNLRDSWWSFEPKIGGTIPAKDDR